MNAALNWLQVSAAESPNKKNGLLVSGGGGGGGGGAAADTSSAGVGASNNDADGDAKGGEIAAASIPITNDDDNDFDPLPPSIVPPRTYKWDCNAIRQMILDFLSTKGNQLYS